MPRRWAAEGRVPTITASAHLAHASTTAFQWRERVLMARLRAPELSGGVKEALVEDLRVVASVAVADAWSFDLDHVGAELGQQVAGNWT